MNDLPTNYTPGDNLSPAAHEPLDVSVVIVSFNTRALLRRCIETLLPEIACLRAEIIVVDNASRDGSADMVETHFPQINVVRSAVNLGFAAANNMGFRRARGRYVALLNSDAFVGREALRIGVRRMDAMPQVAMAGAKLLSRDGSLQPSARLFPTPLNDLLVMSGLAARYPKSRFFGRFDRTWADPETPASVDWVPGAFALIRRSVLECVGHFDEQFFLYYEEVDLCRRIREAGHAIAYWPDLQVIHLGGESSKTMQDALISKSGSQLVLWRMRSALLYYRKHHGLPGTAATALLEAGWHALRAAKNLWTETAREKRAESMALISLMRRAWRETAAGSVSPPRPW